MSRVSLVRHQDFTGGLNLRADAFSLGPNESSDLLNVEVDPRAGFRTRKPWVDWETVADAGTWDPRALYTHTKADGTEIFFLAQDDEIWINAAGTFTSTGKAITGAPHGADFTSWKDDVFATCGRDTISRRWNGIDSTWTDLVDPTVGATWTTNPLSPVPNNMPKAEFVATHSAYLWCANTLEGGTAHPFRVRWSLPNDPDAWDQLDYIDIPQGGGPITGIMPYRDHLLVFFPKAVYAIYGGDRDTLQRVKITTEVGAVNRQCIAGGESAVYFVSWPEGVHRITGGGLDEVSISLRPAFESSGWLQDTDDQWLAFVNQKVYWTVPFDEDNPPTGPSTVFVFDPSLESWTMHRLGDESALAPFTSSVALDTPLGCHRTEKVVLQEGTYLTAVDVVNTVQLPFLARYRTSWMHDGTTTIKKRWKRPDIVAGASDIAAVLDVFVYHDYDEANAKRTKILNLGSASAGTWFADPAPQSQPSTHHAPRQPPAHQPTTVEAQDPTTRPCTSRSATANQHQ